MSPARTSGTAGAIARESQRPNRSITGSGHLGIHPSAESECPIQADTGERPLAPPMGIPTSFRSAHRSRPGIPANVATRDPSRLDGGARMTPIHFRLDATQTPRRFRVVRRWRIITAGQQTLTRSAGHRLQCHLPIRTKATMDRLRLHNGRRPDDHRSQRCQCEDEAMPPRATPMQLQPPFHLLVHVHSSSGQASAKCRLEPSRFQPPAVQRYPFGLRDCQRQASAHIASTPSSARHPSNDCANSGSA